MEAVNQDPQAARAAILEAMPKAIEKVSDTRFRFEFLSSPVRMLGENGLLAQLEVEDTTLVLKDGDTKARSTGNKRTLDVETVIFAIGDKVDETFGLPIEWNEFVKNTSPAFPVEGISYECFDMGAQKPIEGIFVGGWARKASDGLVGYARKDGINAAKAVWGYLQTKQPDDSALKVVTSKITGLHKPAVTKADILRLEAIETEEARKRGVEEFKFSSNEDMLRAMGLTIAA
jgi:ferredoxin--NADP+ reductase